ncbi:MAG: glycosyltransferase family 4 protein [Opitutaceae bacterium]|nr:glycosyltransferase family 4 protein [Opitutaceae bacterium]
MRIAFISTVYGYAFSGADSLWTRAAEVALSRGDTVFIGATPAVAAHPRIDAMIRGGAQHFPCQAPTIPSDTLDRFSRKLEYVSGNSDSLVSALHGFRPDRVIFSCGGTYDLVREGRVLGFLRTRRTPYWVIANWQTEKPALGPLDLERARACFRNAGRLFFVSHRNLEITRRHLDLPLSHAELIQVPIRLPKAGGAPWPDTDVPAFAVIARLEPVKALDILLPAIAKSPGNSEPWLLNLYGEGAEQSALQHQASRLGLSDRVRFRGFVSSLDEIWRENHCLISSSRDEGLPTVMIEGLMYARPVIATRVGAASEWIDEGVTGFTCEPESVEALGAAINRAWRVRSTWRSMGAEAHHRALERYAPDDALRLIEPAFAVY